MNVRKKKTLMRAKQNEKSLTLMKMMIIFRMMMSLTRGKLKEGTVIRF